MSSISPEHVALCLTAALKLPDIQELLKQITQPSREEFAEKEYYQSQIVDNKNNLRKTWMILKNSYKSK